MFNEHNLLQLRIWYAQHYGHTHSKHEPHILLPVYSLYKTYIVSIFVCVCVWKNSLLFTPYYEVHSMEGCHTPSSIIVQFKATFTRRNGLAVYYSSLFTRTELPGLESEEREWFKSVWLVFQTNGMRGWCLNHFCSFSCFFFCSTFNI